MGRIATRQIESPGSRPGLSMRNLQSASRKPDEANAVTSGADRSEKIADRSGEMAIETGERTSGIWKSAAESQWIVNMTSGDMAIATTSTKEINQTTNAIPKRLEAIRQRTEVIWRDLKAISRDLKVIRCKREVT